MARRRLEICAISSRILQSPPRETTPETRGRCKSTYLLDARSDGSSCVLRPEYSVPGTWNQKRSARRISLAPLQPALGPSTQLLERDPERFELRTRRSPTSSAELRARRTV